MPPFPSPYLPFPYIAPPPHPPTHSTSRSHRPGSSSRPSSRPSPPISRAPSPLDPQTALFYRSQILDNCRLLFPSELPSDPSSSSLTIITAPNSAYIATSTSPPKILLDAKGGLKELYIKSQERVAELIHNMHPKPAPSKPTSKPGHRPSSSTSALKPSLYFPQIHGPLFNSTFTSPSAPTTFRASPAPVPTATGATVSSVHTPTVGTPLPSSSNPATWGRDADSALLSYQAIHRSERRRKKEAEKLERRRARALAAQATGQQVGGEDADLEPEMDPEGEEEEVTERRKTREWEERWRESAVAGVRRWGGAGGVEGVGEKVRRWREGLPEVVPRHGGEDEGDGVAWPEEEEIVWSDDEAEKKPIIPAVPDREKVDEGAEADAESESSEDLTRLQDQAPKHETAAPTDTATESGDSILATEGETTPAGGIVTPRSGPQLTPQITPDTDYEDGYEMVERCDTDTPPLFTESGPVVMTVGIERPRMVRAKSG